MKTTLPTRLLATSDEIAKARLHYLEQHFDFFGPNGVAANLGEDTTEEMAKQAWKQTLTPPAFVQESWILIFVWAFWCMWSEYTLPMFVAVLCLSLYAAVWLYFGLLSPLLHRALQ